LNKDDKNAASKFHEVQAAYDLLSDDSKKAAYDSYGHAGVEAEEAGMGGMGGGGRGGGEGFEQFMGAEELFNRMFAEMGGAGRGGRGGRSSASRGGDVQTVATVSFMEAVAGCAKTVTAPVQVSCEGCKGTGSADGKEPVVCSACKGLGQQVMQSGMMMMSTTCRKCGGAGSMIKNPCKQCSGSGAVRRSKTVHINVPAGVETGMNLRLSGEGDVGERGGGSGHFYVRINVEEDPFFRREGTDVHCDVPITFSQAALGATIPVPTVRGEAEVRVPPGTQPGEKSILRGKGLRRVGGMASSAGNQVIHFKVEVPRNLSPGLKEAIIALAAEEEKMGGGAGSGGKRGGVANAGVLSGWRSFVDAALKRVAGVSGGEKNKSGEGGGGKT